MLVIGLTGGIGSGKTAVSDAFALLGVPVIDTDLLAREVVQPGQPALAEIASEFGSACLDGSGNLDRRYLRQEIFASPQRRERLEAILHPRIFQAVRERLTSLQAPYCLVVIPLLAETRAADLIDRILVVDAPESEQIRRVMARDGVDEEQAQRALQAQARRAQRLEIADDVLDNSGDLAELQSQVAALHQRYLGLARA